MAKLLEIKYGRTVLCDVHAKFISFEHYDLKKDLELIAKRNVLFFIFGIIVEVHEIYV